MSWKYHDIEIPNQLPCISITASRGNRRLTHKVLVQGHKALYPQDGNVSADNKGRYEHREYSA